MKLKRFAHNDIVYSREDPSDAVFFVLQGEVNLMNNEIEMSKSKKYAQVLMRCKPGDIVGDISVLYQGLR